jgi:hypothetical protein
MIGSTCAGDRTKQKKMEMRRSIWVCVWVCWATILFCLGRIAVRNDLVLCIDSQAICCHPTQCVVFDGVWMLCLPTGNNNRKKVKFVKLNLFNNRVILILCVIFALEDFAREHAGKAKRTIPQFIRTTTTTMERRSSSSSSSIAFNRHHIIVVRSSPATHIQPL